MDILVLGGSQFLGLHLVRALVEHSHNVTVLNRGLTPVQHPAEVRQLRADRSNLKAMKQAVNTTTFDAVFDISGISPSHITIALNALKGKVGHWLHTSTVAVYAPTKILPIAEDSPLEQNPGGRQYSLDKAKCERLLRAFSNRSDLPVTMLRPTNIYGPDNSVVSREFALFAKLEQQRKIPLPAHGLSMLPLVHVDDVVQGFLHSMGNPSAYGHAFNIVSEDLQTLNGWVQTAGKIVGITPQIISVPPHLESYLEWSPNIPVPPGTFPFAWRTSLVFSIEKARRLLGYVPRHTLAKGLQQTYNWYRQQPKDRWSWDFSQEDECLRRLNSDAPTSW